MKKDFDIKKLKNGNIRILLNQKAAHALERAIEYAFENGFDLDDYLIYEDKLMINLLGSRLLGEL